MTRLPTRTLVLMTLALFAFAWFWWKTHERPARVPRMVLIDLIDGGVP